MFKGLFITGSMLGLLGDFVQEQGISIPEVDEAIVQYGSQSRVSFQLWSGLLEKISVAVADPAVGLAIGSRVVPRHVGVLLGESNTSVTGGVTLNPTLANVGVGLSVIINNQIPIIKQYLLNNFISSLQSVN